MALAVDDALARLFARPIAHRGLHAAGGTGPVENSLGAAKAAIARGYGIECDVQLSRDGEAMVFHDADLDRLTGATGLLRDWEAPTLATLQLGETEDRIPTLSQLLATIGGRVPLVVEVKTDGRNGSPLIARTLDVLEGYGGVVAVESFDPSVVHRCRELGHARPVGLVGPAESGAPLPPDMLALCDFFSWSIDHLAEVAGLGLPLSTWTVRSPAQAALASDRGAQIVFEGFVPLTKR